MSNAASPMIRTTTAGALPEGFVMASIYNEGPGDGTIDGVLLPALAGRNWLYAGGVRYQTVPYDPDGNTFVVVVVTE